MGYINNQPKSLIFIKLSIIVWNGIRWKKGYKKNIHSSKQANISCLHPVHVYIHPRTQTNSISEFYFLQKSIIHQNTYSYQMAYLILTHLMVFSKSQLNIIVTTNVLIIVINVFLKWIKLH